MKGFSYKRIATESRCVKGTDNKYTICRHVRASFSPEILQARTVKELMEVAWQQIDAHLGAAPGKGRFSFVHSPYNNNNNNNNNNVHLSCAHQRPERSHDTY